MITGVCDPVRPQDAGRDPAFFDAVVTAPFGALGLRVQGESVTRVALLVGVGVAAAQPADSPFAARVADALQRYLEDPRQPFAFPLAPQGTGFQQRVWHALRAIPLGETRSYGALARQLGSSARAVGGACGSNPIAVVVPCHRVVAAHGLGGFSGQTDGEWLAVKRWLLHHEGVSLVGS